MADECPTSYEGRYSHVRSGLRYRSGTTRRAAYISADECPASWSFCRYELCDDAT